MGEENYWQRRMRPGGVSRRRFLGGAATAGLGATAFGLVGCGDDDDDDDKPATTSPAATGTTAAATGTATAATATGTPAVTKQKGGIARFTSANATYDTFDADRTRFGPMGTILNYANQGVVQWASFTQAKLGGYFAESWEQPDTKTVTFKIRNQVWHNKPPVNGRATNANDVKFHFERNKAGLLKDGTKDPNFYRKTLFEVVDKVEAVDTSTVKVTMTKPWPFLLNTLAGTWTKVQAPEAVDKFEAEYAKFNQEQIIGTGDFVLTDFKSDGTLGFRRHEKATRHQVNWDGVDFVPLFTDPAAQQAAFEQKQIDSISPPNIAVVEDLLKRLAGKIYEVKVFTPNPVLSAWYGGTPPWSDPRLIGAIMRTIDRRALIQQLVQGRGAIAAWIPPAWAPFALPEKELVKYPGFLEDRAKDLSEAKAMWAAGGGDKLGEVTVDIPDIFEGLYAGVGAVIGNQLKGTLGNEFKVKLEPYSTITAKLVGQKYGNGTPNVWFGWGNPPSDPDTSLDYINAFNSKSNNFKQWEVKMPGMDELTDKMGAEFDLQKRITLNHEAARITLEAHGGGITGLFEAISNLLYWNYFKLGEITHQVTSHNVGRDLWFDQKDASWAGRKA